VDAISENQQVSRTPIKRPLRKKVNIADTAFTYRVVRLWSPADDGAVDMYEKGLRRHSI
jgi:hypothetical protein